MSTYLSLDVSVCSERAGGSRRGLRLTQMGASVHRLPTHASEMVGKRADPPTLYVYRNARKSSVFTAGGVNRRETPQGMVLRVCDRRR